MEPQQRTSERTVSASAVVASYEDSPYGRSPHTCGPNGHTCAPGGQNWGRWLNDGIPNPHVCIELFRLVLIVEFPLPNRGVPRWLLYISNTEIYPPWFSSIVAEDSRILMNFDELRALMRREHRIGICQWRELVIRRMRTRFLGGGFPHDFEYILRNSALRGLRPDIIPSGPVGRPESWGRMANNPLGQSGDQNRGAVWRTTPWKMEKACSTGTETKTH